VPGPRGIARAAAVAANNCPTAERVASGKLAVQNPTETAGDMTQTDPSLERLQELCKLYQESLKQTNSIRYTLDTYIQQLKKLGYSYPVLSRNSCFAQGTIQLIVAKNME